MAHTRSQSDDEDFAWTVNPPQDIVYDEHINTIMKTDNAAKAIKFITDACNRSTKMNPSLKQLIESGLDHMHKHPDDEVSCLFATELLAGLKYAAENDSIGRMRMLTKAIRKTGDTYPVEWLIKQLKQQDVSNSRMWFRLRAMCMDAYALVYLRNAREELVLYYCGNLHATCALSELVQDGASESSSNFPNMYKKLSKACDEHGIVRMTCLRKKDKEYWIIGENHKRTQLPFAKKLLDLLREACNHTPMLFLIEKHASRGRDPIPRMLMCNQPDIAIHQTRCSAFLEQDYKKCKQLQVIAVDSRHNDMGFLRMELFDMWDRSSEFRRSAKAFHQEALRTMEENLRKMI